MIFIFSALNPKQWNQAVRNIWKVLKPGGQVLFRDYGRGDLAQVRFKKGRWMEENFYVRGDGTRVYFFEQQELEHIWGHRKSEKEGETQDQASKETGGDVVSQVENLALNSSTKEGDIPAQEDGGPSPEEKDDELVPSFDIVHFGVDRRMLVNRQRRLKMYRCWMQAVFRKDAAEPGRATEVATSTLRQDKAAIEGAEEES